MRELIARLVIAWLLIAAACFITANAWGGSDVVLNALRSRPVYKEDVARSERGDAMSEENWVKLPEPAPKTLPAGTRLQTRHGFRWELQGPHMLSSEWGLRRRQAYLGHHIDLCTGADLSGALCEASDIERVSLPLGYHFSGSEVVKDEPEPELLAGTVGLEKYANEAYRQSVLEKWIQAKPSDGLGLSDYVFRQGDYEQQRFSAIQSQAQAQQRALEKLTKKPACSCGATENVRLEWGDWGKAYQCGPCYQTRRRAELAAQKLAQAKRDLDKPVKRDPYE